MAGTTVLDVGSRSIKAGISLQFPYDSAPDVIAASSVQDQDQDGVRHVSRRGEIVDWEALDALLDYVFYERVGWERGQEGTLLLCEPLLVTRSQREQMSLLLFERFGVEGVFVQDSAVLSLYSVGRLTGCVMDAGHTKIDIAPVYEGLLRMQGVRRLPFGGIDLTHQLAKSLGIWEEAAEKLKEQCASICELSEIFDGLDGETKRYSLPDGQTIDVKEEQCSMMGELLFRPDLMEVEGPGIAEAIYNATYCQTDLPSKRQHLENILLCGGGSLIPNLPSRMFKDLQCLLPPSLQPGFCTVPEYMPSKTQHHAAWMGGAILSKVVTQHGHMATKADYDEVGPSVLHRKFHTSF